MNCVRFLFSEANHFVCELCFAKMDRLYIFGESVCVQVFLVLWLDINNFIPGKILSLETGISAQNDFKIR